MWPKIESNFYIFMMRLYWKLLKTKKGQLSLKIISDETWKRCDSWNGRERSSNSDGFSFHVWFLSRCSKGGPGKEKKTCDMRQEQDKSARSHSHFISNLYCCLVAASWTLGRRQHETTNKKNIWINSPSNVKKVQRNLKSPWITGYIII